MSVLDKYRVNTGQSTPKPTSSSTKPVTPTIVPTPKTEKKGILESAFDKENYIEKFKRGDVGGGVANLLGTVATAPQALYLNSLNALQDIAKGKKPSFQYQMGYTDYEKSVADRQGATPLSERIDNPLLRGAYRLGMEVGTDPLELTPLGFYNDIKLAKGTAQTTGAYADSLQAGKLVPTVKGTKRPNVSTQINPMNRPVQPQTPSNGVIPNPVNDEAIAKVLTSTDPARRTLKEFGSDVVGQAKRKFVDSGDTVAKIAREVKDDVLYPLYNNAKQSPRRGEHMIGVAQTNLHGEKIGKSLQEIFRPIQAKGDDYYRRFQEYLYHMHNVDRMSIIDNAERAVREFELRYPDLVDVDYKELVKLSKDAEGGGSVASEYVRLIDALENAKNKPVFGDTITADISTRKASELLQNNPEFANLADDVYTFNRNNMQYRVEGGLLTQDQADYMLQMYPHYVPTYRTPTSSKGAIAKGNLVEISKTLKKAKGSNKDLIPLHESMARQTMQVVEASNKNVFANRLVDTVGEKTQKYIRDVTPTDEMLDIDLDEIPKLKNHLKLYRDGKAYDVEVDDTLYEGLKALSPTKDSNSLVRAATAVNTGFKQLITGWNPIFLIRNGASDIQNVGLYSKNLKEFATKYPTAWKEMTTNGELWQQYKALGGIGSSFFDYAKGFKNDPTWLRANTIDRVETLNLAVEQLPRFTEFIAYIAKNGDDYDSLMKAMYNSADVTVNFGRSGTWGKTLNSTFVPFFNPAIQGTSKLIRRFTETKGVKGWTELVIKAAALGVAPSLINEMVYTNDPQYNEIPARERDINYIFKVGDNQWVKIPKGRVLSLFGSPAQRLVRMKKGDKDSFAGWVGTMLDQVAPISPTESNILSPIAAVKNNKSWYGTPIEPRRLEKYAPGKRADERTTVAAKWLGDKLGYSPKKIDYLFDAYSGVIGDIAIPLMTPSAERDPFTKAFTIDSITTNEVPQKFYDKLDEVYYAKNEPSSDATYDIMYRYLNKQNALVADLSSRMRKIDGSKMDNKTKKEKIRELKDLSNGIQRTALETLKQVEKATKKLSKTNKDPEILYREVNKEVFGSEYALKTYNKKVYEKATQYVKDGVTYDIYYDLYFKTKDIESDKDKNGNPISAGSKFEWNGTGKSASLKKKEIIDSIKGLSEKDRRSLYEAFDVSDKVAKRIVVPVKK